MESEKEQGEVSSPKKKRPDRSSEGLSIKSSGFRLMP